MESYTPVLQQMLQEGLKSTWVEIKGAKFFNTSSAKNLVYVEKSDNRSQASKREWAIKKLNRPEKLKTTAFLYKSSII